MLSKDGKKCLKHKKRNKESLVCGVCNILIKTYICITYITEKTFHEMLLGFVFVSI